MIQTSHQISWILRSYNSKCGSCDPRTPMKESSFVHKKIKEKKYYIKSSHISPFQFDSSFRWCHLYDKNHVKLILEISSGSWERDKIRVWGV